MNIQTRSNSIRQRFVVLREAACLFQKHYTMKLWLIRSVTWEPCLNQTLDVLTGLIFRVNITQQRSNLAAIICTTPSGNEQQPFPVLLIASTSRSPNKPSHFGAVLITLLVSLLKFAQITATAHFAVSKDNMWRESGEDHDDKENDRVGGNR